MARALLIALPCALLLAGPAAAGAVTRAELTGYADRAAAVWAERQSPGGEFLDPHSGRPSGGYGNAMIGYALLRAGERAGDPELVRAGVRGVDSALGEEPAVRGVFDLLAVAAAYNFARESLADETSFAAARPRWEEYLRTTGPPNIENAAQACIVDPGCFHNHEAVETAANLELLASGIEAPALGDAVTLRAAALSDLGQELPAFAGTAARIEGSKPRDGLGLLSDSGSWPLAYHALSTAMLARSIELLGDDAPDAAREALKRTAAATAGFMAPDGTVAYIGRRQQVNWSLAATIAATQEDEPAAADRAFERLKTGYPLTDRGLPIAPRSGEEAFSPKGLDSRPMVFNGITLYLLNVAADAAPRRERGLEPLPLDRDGEFVDNEQGGFAAVRRGDLWYAVHAKPDRPDLRSDYGVIAAKWRSPEGDWVDFVRPRPLATDPDETAGPVIERDGRTIRFGGTDIDVREDGTVVADDVRFEPADRAIHVSLRAREGDVVTYTAYLPADVDPRAWVGAAPAPDPERADRTFASCCDLSMFAERFPVEMQESGTVTFELRVPAEAPAKPAAPAAAPSDETGGGLPWWMPPLALIGLATAALLARRRTHSVRPGG